MINDESKNIIDEDNNDDDIDLLKLVSTDSNDLNQYLIFEGSDGEVYAKNVSKIEELLVYKDIDMIKNEDKNTLILGTANIRGKMTTIVNFDQWLGKEVLSDDEYELVILASYGGHRIGIIVKRVEYIITIEAGSMSDNSLDNPNATFISQINIGGKNRLCTIFDSDKMLLDVFDKVEDDNSKKIESFHSIKSSKLVLYADDSRMIRNMIDKLLNKLDIKFLGYTDGKHLIDALSELDHDDIGLIITDVEMPLMGGRDVVEHIREHPSLNDIDIIVHTNMANDNMRSALMDLGANDIIGKVDMLHLGEAITKRIKH